MINYPERKICFWLHFPSMHHLGLVNAVARAHNLQTTVVFDGSIPMARRNLGWTQPDVSSIDTYIRLDEIGRRELIDRLGPEAVHIFFGFHAYPGVFSAMKYCTAIGRKYFVWMEPVDAGGWKRTFKRFIYSIHALRFNSSLQGVFVTGTMGFPFLLKCGFSEEKLIPFCYPINTRNITQRNAMGCNSEFRIIYVGQLIPCKHVAMLIKALSEMNELNVRATIVGDGPERKALEKLVLKLGLKGDVVFSKSVSNAEIIQLMQAHDLLVLPSKYDGWGFVVNEALSQGTPVLVSDQCGSQDFVKDRLCGEVFAHDSLSSLASKLKALIIKGKWSQNTRDELIDKVQREMSEPVVAGFLLQSIFALEGSDTRPAAPWLRSF